MTGVQTCALPIFYEVGKIKDDCYWDPDEYKLQIVKSILLKYKGNIKKLSKEKFNLDKNKEGEIIFWGVDGKLKINEKSIKLF